MNFQALVEKFDALNQRERILILSLVVTAIIIFFVEIIIVPLDSKYDGVNKQVLSAQSQTIDLKNQLVILKAEKKVATPKQKQEQQLKLLNEQISNVNRRLKENISGLITPKEMAKVLEAVLSQNSNLKLESIEAVASKPLSPLATNDGDEKENFGIYHHGLKIKFKGSYLSTLKYLQVLDNLPWRFYWDILHLNVDKYPVSSIDITVHTLSFNKDWIGV